MYLQIWHKMLSEALPIDVPDILSERVFHMAATAWGSGETYICQFGGTPIDLTHLYEQYRIILTLKGDFRGNKE